MLNVQIVAVVSCQGCRSEPLGFIFAYVYYKYIYYIHVYSSVSQRTVNREEQTEYGVCTYVDRHIISCQLNALNPSGMCCHIVILGRFLFRNVLLLPTNYIWQYEWQ